MCLTDEALVISCEHGGNRIPAPYRELFVAHKVPLDTHRGFDPGALVMARALASDFGAPLVASTVSRLLVDLNRSPGHPRLHFETVRRAPLAIREQILARCYQPYRLRAEGLVMEAIARRGRVIHLSCHSFTPELDGKRRTADIGLLYDPSRAGEVELCAHWKAALGTTAPDFTVRRNYPYAGKCDGLTAWFRKRLSSTAYIGIELELNQLHVARPPGQWAALRASIIESLRTTLQHRGTASDA